MTALSRDDVSALRDASLNLDARFNDLDELAGHAETLSIALVRSGDVKAAAGEAERMAHEARLQAADAARTRDVTSWAARDVEEYLDRTDGFGPEDSFRWAAFWTEGPGSEE